MSKKPKMVVCKNCNTQIAKNAKICPACGAKNKKPFYKKWWFILLVIVIGIGIISSIGGSKKEKYDWNEVELSDRLPEPKSNIGTIIVNDSDKLSMYVEKTSKSDYKAYIEKCQSMGYTVDSEKDGDNYNAFDEEGYGLDLSYIEETMYIDLEAPIEMGTLNWPKSEIASLLPLPKSTVGKVSTDTADGCYIYVGETSIDDFNAYADECAEYGFTVDYERGDKFYNAKDENGNQLSLSYQGNNVMIIQIRKPDEVQEDKTEVETEIETEASSEIETESAHTETEKSDDNAELVDGMRPEFKEAMDSYEAFYDEYCDFMEKYNENPTDLELIAEYTDMCEKLIEMNEKFAAWENEDLNSEELKYYAEVNGRITQKLLEVGE